MSCNIVFFLVYHSYWQENLQFLSWTVVLLSTKDLRPLLLILLLLLL